MQDPSNNNFSQQLERLREQAKARLNQDQSAEVNEESSVDDVVDELQLQRTALEIQYEELQQLYQEYWNLYEFAPCGYITLNDKGIIQRINCRGVELLGATKETPTQFGLSQFIRSEHQSYFFRALQEAQQRLETQSLELQFSHPNNTYLWLHLDIQPQLKQNNQVQQWHIALTDVTAEKEAEKAREKANRLQLITDSVQGGIAYIDRDQCYQFVNQTYQNWLGLTANEILGKTVEEVIGKEEAYSQSRIEALQKVWQGKATCYEARRSYQNQEMRDVSIMLVPDWDEQGTVEGFYSLIIDITERKESERRVRQQEEFLRSIYEGVKQAIFVMDVDEEGELQWADYNWMSEQLMGVPRTQAKGKSPEELFSPHLAQHIRENYEHCLATGHIAILDEL